VKMSEMTGKRLLDHCRDYPDLQVRDLFKFLHQSAFGCEHLISSPEKVIGYIRQEFTECRSFAECRTEPLDGSYSRVHLGWMSRGLSAETLGKLFFLSAKKEPDGCVLLEQKLEAAKKLAYDGLLPFSVDELSCAAETWKQQGYPAVRHTDAFRSAYHPAYRVIANDFIPYLPLFAEIDTLLERYTVKVSVCNADQNGKLRFLLNELYDCTISCTSKDKLFVLAGESNEETSLSADTFLLIFDR